MTPALFPRSLPEFVKMFPDDASCAKYLEAVRWADGFKCPSCNVTGDPFRFANRPGVVQRVIRRRFGKWELTG